MVECKGYGTMTQFLLLMVQGECNIHLMQLNSNESCGRNVNVRYSVLNVRPIEL